MTLHETGSAHDETSSSGNKDDDDDDEDDPDDLKGLAHHDPERLKAFNVSASPSLPVHPPPPQVMTTSGHSADVRPALRRREPRPDGAHLEAAQGEDPGDHRLLHEAVPGVRGQGPQEDPDLPEVVPEEQEVAGHLGLDGGGK